MISLLLKPFLLLFFSLQPFITFQTQFHVSRFNFNDGKVTMSGRMIESANYNKSVEAGEMVPTISLAHVLPNDWSWFEMMEGAVNGYDNTNVLVWKLGPQDRHVGEVNLF